jgi:hypothetical protein
LSLTGDFERTSHFLKDRSLLNLMPMGSRPRTLGKKRQLNLLDLRRRRYTPRQERARRLACLEGAQAAVEYWQVKRGGGSRGIVEIIEENP